jgi:4-hydroxy-3-methylbut-2-enyl diphosphate reductase
MEVIRAKEAGFCFGVKQAIDRISTLHGKGDIFVLGKLIHNPQVIDELKGRGIKFVDNLDEVDHGTLVISAHGIPDHIIHEAKKKGLDVIDTTCSLVKNVHNITKELEKKGYKIIIFGDKNHTEVKGITGNLDDPIVISGVDDLDNISPGKYALVSQTTQEVIRFNEIGDKLKKNITDLIIKDTICSATKLRQESAKQVAMQSDLMIVVGGLNSANTRRLKEICSKIVHTVHIESTSDIDRSLFYGKNIIGVTAGASTPENVIKEVIGLITNR